MGIDIWEVIEAARTKPYGFTAFYPGPGLGGHCIPIDPFYLTWKARAYGKSTRFIELAGEVNTAMPDYVVAKVIEGLNRRGKAVNGSRILLVGLAYKPNISDERESPTYAIWDQLDKMGGEVSYYDPYIPVVPRKRRFGEFSGQVSLSWESACSMPLDAAVICTAHRCVQHDDLIENIPVIVDTRNTLTACNRVLKA